MTELLTLTNFVSYIVRHFEQDKQQRKTENKDSKKAQSKSAVDAISTLNAGLSEMKG